MRGEGVRCIMKNGTPARVGGGGDLATPALAHPSTHNCRPVEQFDMDMQWRNQESCNGMIQIHISKGFRDSGKLTSAAISDSDIQSGMHKEEK